MLGRILRNLVYIGKVHYKGNIYEGEHEGIVQETLFNEVQELLNNQNRRNNENTEIGKYLLFQKLYNKNGEMFKCDACVKTNKSKTKTTKVRYNYYITEDKSENFSKLDNKNEEKDSLEGKEEILYSRGGRKSDLAIKMPQVAPFTGVMRNYINCRTQSSYYWYGICEEAIVSKSNNINANP